MTPAECNYGIGDKELLAIVKAFEEWHNYLEGVRHTVIVYTDHLNLQTLMTKQLLNRRQARWASFFSNYDFKIQYRPGTKNGKADALTRRSGDLPKEGDGRSRITDTILRPENFDSNLSIAAISQAVHQPIVNALAHDPLAQDILKSLKNGDKRHNKIPIGECEIRDNLLLVYGLVYVPNNEEILAQVIRSCHDVPAAGHPGRAATYELITRDYWWPGMRRTIARYVDNCDTCSRTKPVRHAPYGFLKPLQIPQRRWDSVSMDFIVGLPESQGKNAIMVVIDRLSKMAHFIPAREDPDVHAPERLDVKQVARLYRDNVFKHHGLPSYLLSDRGSVFTSKISRALYDITGIKHQASTAFHPETDGQTERINSILEQYLRGYCNYQQNDWANLLSMAEFKYNNTLSGAIGMTPFFANYGYHPRYELGVKPESSPTPEILKDYQDQMRKLDDYLRAEMKYAQGIQAEQADKHRISPPNFQPGDKVWLLRKHIKTTRPSDKLDFKRLGKFEILAKVSSHAYKLALPPSMRIHPVFHVSLLEPVHSDPFPGQSIPPPPPPEVINDEEEYVVQEILDSRIWRRQLQYLIRWEGYEQPSWEKATNISHATGLVRKYHRDHPDKPRPNLLPEYTEDDESDNDYA